MSFLLKALSALYLLIIQCRNRLFEWRWFAATKVQALVVSVGNVSAGGTGKTPITSYLSRELESRGYRVAVVSRGYGGSYTESTALVNPQRKDAAVYFGDEPTMLASQSLVPVYVGKSRVDAAERAVLEYHADAVVADDGFQHRWLHRDLDVVVFDATEKRLSMLPFGRLREPLTSLKRADVIFMTRTRLVSPEELEDKTRLLRKYGFFREAKNLFFVAFKISNIVHIHTQARLTAPECVLLSAIGKPENFQKVIEESLRVQRHMIFPDHHSWTQVEWDGILESLRGAGGLPLVITEKDAVKIRALNSNDYPVYFAAMEVVMDADFSMDELLRQKGIV